MVGGGCGPVAHKEQNCSLPVVRRLPGPSNTQNLVTAKQVFHSLINFILKESQ